MSETATSGKKKPGRKAETPAQRLARLEQDLAAARKAVEDGKRRALAAIGSAVLDEAAGDQDFGARLRHIVEKHVTRKADRADVMGLLTSAAKG